jgi:hypothetical protein
MAFAREMTTIPQVPITKEEYPEKWDVFINKSLQILPTPLNAPLIRIKPTQSRP